MQKLVITTICVLLFSPLFGLAFQHPTKQKEIDSLLRISQGLLRTNNDSAQIAAKVALEIGRTSSDSVRMANAEHMLGNVYFVRGVYDSALNFWNKALQFRIKNGDQSKIADSYNNISLAYERQGNYMEAITALEKALEFYKVKADSADMGTVYGNLAILYESMRDFENSLYFHQKAYPFIRQDEEMLSRHYVNVGRIYSAQEAFDTAHHLFNKSLKIKEKLEDYWGIAVVLSCIAEAYDWQNQKDSAIVVYERSKQYMKRLNADHLLAMANIQLAKLNHQMGNTDKAFEMLRESEQFIEEQDTGSQLDAYLMLAQIYLERKEYQKSSEFFNRYSEREEELRNADLEGNLAKQKAEFYYREKQDDEKELLALQNELYSNKINQEKKSKNFLYLLILMIIVIFGLSTAFFQRIIKKNKELIVQRKEISRLNAVQERLLKMKSNQLMNTNEIIEKYAHRNAHDLRGPLARILGILNLFETGKVDKDDLWRRMKDSARELESVVYKIARELEKEQK